ncbi:MAG: epoxyqueuosine reductase QueH [Lachnospiraceae bacterium]|nr:epoxyqueuosine reductase QueH [Lachnospiraceae bacterium]
MNARNFETEMENMIASVRERGEKPALLLHACCAPCASACLLRLMEDFAVTAFYYNPNITDAEEYHKRLEELKRLAGLLNEAYEDRMASPVRVAEGPFEPELFYERVRGLEACAEGGERCFLCYEQRLEKTLRVAQDEGFAYFATTLTLSPLKNAARINEIGERLAAGSAVRYLVSDFKKKDGYKKSIELSEKYGLYRQRFCGCEFSRR